MATVRITPYPDNPNFFYIVEPVEGIKPHMMDALKEHFKVFDESVKHTYDFKNNIIDGMVYFVSGKHNKFLIGLKSKVIRWCVKNNINVEDATPAIDAHVTKEEIQQFMENIGFEHKPFPFQIEMVYQSITNSRQISIAAVGSGKSFAIYCLIRWFLRHNKKFVILTPDLMLKTQLYNDFKGYYYNLELKLKALKGQSTNQTHTAKIDAKLESIRLGRIEDNIECFEDVIELVDDKESKFSDKPIKIVNWHSIINLIGEDFYSGIDGIIIDEVHKAGSAESYMKILEACEDATYRIGFTGTKPSDPLDRLMLDGLIGKSQNIITLRQLINLGLATEVFIQPMLLQYSKEVVDRRWRGTKSLMTYPQEQAYFRTYQPRINFIAELTSFVAGRGGGQTTIVLTKNRDAQKAIVEALVKLGQAPLEINGSVKAKQREILRQLASEGGNIIIVGGQQILSTGINIPSLTNIINIGGKTEIGLIQSIGRSTRKMAGKESAQMYDIVDDVRYYGSRGGVKDNYAYNHYKFRVVALMKYDLIVRKEKVVKITDDGTAHNHNLV